MQQKSNLNEYNLKTQEKNLRQDQNQDEIQIREEDIGSRVNLQENDQKDFTDYQANKENNSISIKLQSDILRESSILKQREKGQRFIGSEQIQMIQESQFIICQNKSPKKRNNFNLISEGYFGKAAKLMFLCRKFVRVLKEKIEQKHSLDHLGENQFSLIQDLSCQYSYKDEVEKSQKQQQILLRGETAIQHKLRRGSTNLVRVIQFKKFIYFYNSFRIMKPHSKSYFYLNLISILLQVLRIFFCSIKIFLVLWQAELYFLVYSKTVHILFALSFFLEIFLNINTAQVKTDGSLLLIRSQLTSNYFKNKFGFIIDLLTIIPLLIPLFFFYNFSVQILAISSLFELFYFYKQSNFQIRYNQLELYLTQYHVFADWLPLFKLQITVIYTAHYVGLIFFTVGKIQQDWLQIEGQTIGIEATSILDLEWFHQYSLCLFWGLGVMVTIVWHIPSGFIDVLYTIFTITLTMVVFGYSVNTIGIILSNIQKKKSGMIEEVQQFNRYLRKNKIDGEMRSRVLEYITHLHEFENSQNQVEEEQLMLRLTPHLKDELISQIRQPYQNKLVALNFLSKQTMTKVLSKLKKKSISKGEIIYEQNQSDTSNNLYLIISGKVEAYYLQKDDLKKNKEQNAKNKRRNNQLNINISTLGEKRFFLKKKRWEQQKQIQQEQEQQENNGLREKGSDFRITSFVEGDLFGEYSFFTGIQREISVRALETCTVLFLEREDFIEQIKGHDKDFEIFSQIKDDLVYKKTSEYLSLFCLSCFKKGHFTNQCQDLHYIVDFQTSIQQNNDKNILRKKHQRRDKSMRLNSLNILEEVQFSQDMLVKSKSHELQDKICEINKQISFQQNKLQLEDQILNESNKQQNNIEKSFQEDQFQIQNDNQQKSNELQSNLRKKQNLLQDNSFKKSFSLEENNFQIQNNERQDQQETNLEKNNQFQAFQFNKDEIEIEIENQKEQKKENEKINLNEQLIKQKLDNNKKKQEQFIHQHYENEKKYEDGNISSENDENIYEQNNFHYDTKFKQNIQLSQDQKQKLINLEISQEIQNNINLLEQNLSQSQIQSPNSKRQRSLTTNLHQNSKEEIKQKENFNLIKLQSLQGNNSKQSSNDRDQMQRDIPIKLKIHQKNILRLQQELNTENQAQQIKSQNSPHQNDLMQNFINQRKVQLTQFKPENSQSEIYNNQELFSPTESYEAQKSIKQISKQNKQIQKSQLNGINQLTRNIHFIKSNQIFDQNLLDFDYIYMCKTKNYKFYYPKSNLQKILDQILNKNLNPLIKSLE